MITSAEQIDNEFTSKQRAKLTKGNMIKILVATLFYLATMIILIILGV